MTLSSPAYNGRLTTPFTEEDDVDIRYYAETHRSARECAAHLNRTRNSIISRAHRIGVRFIDPIRHPEPVPPRHQHPVRLGQHKSWLNQNMSAAVPVHHDRGLDDDE